MQSVFNDIFDSYGKHCPAKVFRGTLMGCKLVPQKPGEQPTVMRYINSKGEVEVSWLAWTTITPPNYVGRHRTS